MKLNRFILLLLAGTVFTVSCTRVELASGGDAKSYVLCDFGSLPAGVPENYALMFARTTYSVHDTATVKTDMTDTLNAFGGNYFAIACSIEEDGPFSFVNKESFVAKPDSVSIHDIYAALQEPELPEDDVFYRSLWHIASDPHKVVAAAVPLWLAQDTQTLSGKPGNVERFHFAPRDVTQQITVKIKLASEDASLTIEKVAACLTGVPSRIRLVDGSVNTADYGRTIADCEAGESGLYSAQFRTLGLFPPENATDKYGAGILEVAVKLEGYSLPVSAKINLSPFLAKAGIMKVAAFGDAGWLERDAASVMLDIASKYTLKVSKPVDDSLPLARWDDSDSGHISVVPEDPDA
ncbi:MAG: hypothetical protein IJQ61_05100 [Bacteroidales bacterium]|nr:hypothetical protein [Bacteroidales bacterium]